MDRKRGNEVSQGGVETRSGAKGSSIRIRFMYKGVECRETLKIPATKANIAYASRLKGEILNAIEKGTFNYADYFPDSKRASLFGHAIIKSTMNDLFDSAISGWEQAVQNGTMSPSTLDGYKKIVSGRLRPAMGEKLLRDVGPAFLRTWIGALGVTAKTARNIISPLRSVFDDAMNDGMIDFNPLDRVALRKLLSQTSHKSDYVVDPFSIEEIEAILKFASGNDVNMYQFWFETGLRQGELIALRWSKVDFIHGSVRIEENIVVKEEKGPKTAAGIRDITLTAKALEALQRQKAISFLAGDRVFTHHKTGKGWETEKQIRMSSWTPLLKRAGVRYRNPYQIRHTFASHHVSNGANLWWLARQLGHETIEMIIRHYGKWVPLERRNLGENWANTTTAGGGTRQQRKTAD
ncbi:site-specific integrase [Chromobacterium subtsugae]|uniref:Site-specific integrase n=2 Tax=Chromobacteriaceae TaxID=1499392 RepID=A0ABS7FG79_9NEIS|nr:site-specific integrase [Chromobacterium subtsugae]MBW7567843.1 site-specific integrase [Chromobacterium subtsugae]MBW8289070.1 site-specific integrase [Chromobacterium subtsugae]WSE93786.1 site-specific integrase [Chromobacterium subtsugae]WVH62163.1 site-specific integrase [Chromobacterium subtsugae]